MGAKSDRGLSLWGRLALVISTGMASLSPKVQWAHCPTLSFHRQLHDLYGKPWPWTQSYSLQRTAPGLSRRICRQGLLWGQEVLQKPEGMCPNPQKLEKRGHREALHGNMVSGSAGQSELKAVVKHLHGDAIVINVFIYMLIQVLIVIVLAMTLHLRMIVGTV